MTGLVCALSPERKRLVIEEPTLVHDIADRSVDVPGRMFFEFSRLEPRLRAYLPEHAALLACLGGSLGYGFGDKSGWAYGRPRIVDGEALEALGRDLDSLPEDAVLAA